ncbi:hypothetical protein NDU88_002014 [Pleurodeles waltl]|uniref:Uncharacterized protein n=1 Tax=Pleurodeles waltl TaxID=8319 RepID=A0AAV7RA59_PLEWA|nr:hypothetical protein NDU88_002014 [Pleurodeles waltl]
MAWAYICWRDGGGLVIASFPLTFGVANYCGCRVFGGLPVAGQNDRGGLPRPRRCCGGLLAGEIQPHDDPKTTQRGLRSHQPPSGMLCVISPAPGIDLPVALQASIDFQPRSWGCVDFSAADQSCVNLFPARQSERGFLTFVLPTSPFRIPGTGWAPLGRVGVSAETPGAGREKSLLSLRLQITGGKL